MHAQMQMQMRRLAHDRSQENPISYVVIDLLLTAGIPAVHLATVEVQGQAQLLFAQWAPSYQHVSPAQYKP